LGKIFHISRSIFAQQKQRRHNSYIFEKWHIYCIFNFINQWGKLGMKITAGQLMIPIEQYPKVSQEVSLQQAIDILMGTFKTKDKSWQGYEVLFITDEPGNILGLITLRSALLAAKKLNCQKIFGLFRRFSKKGFPHKNIEVGNFMESLKERRVDVKEAEEGIIKLFLTKNFNSVLVSEQGRIIGVIRIIDLLWSIENLI